MFLIQYNQSFSTALEGLLKNVKLDAVGGVKRNIREKRASGHRARIVSVIRLRRFPVVKLREASIPILARNDIGGLWIENFWSTRFQSFPCESTINTIFEGGPLDSTPSPLPSPPGHEGVTFPIMSSLENILSASSWASLTRGIIQRCLEKYFRDFHPFHESLTCTPYYSSRLFFRQIFPSTIALPFLSLSRYFESPR